ncbi:hypothetical protein QAD02_021578 [Eretmocerus hayati]|uniref:Uncharacterized protein n=1 Tax=Eretmocerus hayati TaxID=131215 RepID=A0ACC2PVG7_9HYME|nr:hypothetical protein QAD02_021578 [Eretmocerus hayati]
MTLNIFSHNETMPGKVLKLIEELVFDGLPPHLRRILLVKGFLYWPGSLQQLSDENIDAMQDYVRSNLYVIPADADVQTYLRHYTREQQSHFEITDGERYLLQAIQQAFAKRSKKWLNERLRRDDSAATITPPSVSVNSSIEQNSNTADSGHRTERAGEPLSAAERAKFTQTIRRLVKKHPDYDSDPNLMKTFDAMEIRFGGTSDDPTASAVCPDCETGIKLAYRSESFNAGNFNRRYLKRHLKSNDKTVSAETDGVDAATAPKQSRQNNDNSTENEIDEVCLYAVELLPRANSTTIEESTNNNNSSASSRSASSIPSTSLSSSGGMVASLTTPSLAINGLTLMQAEVEPGSKTTDGSFLNPVISHDASPDLHNVHDLSG